MTTMQIDRAVVEQVLEALEQSETFVPYEGFGMARKEAERKHQASITALRAALAQEQAEPQCTPAWWRDGLTATLMREGINKHRAREIADGYWQAYCEIGDSDD